MAEQGAQGAQGAQGEHGANGPVARVLLLLVRAYQYVISPWLGPRCRFLPSCSAYAAEAIARHGAWRGSALSARRLCRCHPWGGFGLDPVPLTLNQAPPLFHSPSRAAGAGKQT